MTYNVLKWAVGGLLVLLFARPLIQGHSQRYWYIFRLIRPVVVAQNLVVIAATIGLAYGLYSLFPFLDISWIYLIAKGDQATNIAIMPVTLPYVGILYLALFAVNIPLFAAAEERRYRRGTKNWRDGAWRSLRFGLAHWVMGIPLFAALALTLPGLWYTFIYLRDGEDAATTHHTTYNLTLCFLLLIAVSVPSLLKL